MNFGDAPEKIEGAAIKYDPGAPETKLTWADYRFNLRCAWRGLKGSPFSQHAWGEWIGTLCTWPYYL